jgi:5-hydroxyisourate hydrolase
MTASASPITTHVLDLNLGRPAQGMKIVLEAPSGSSPDSWGVLAVGTTDADGRVRDLLSTITLKPGLYRLRFDTGGYFQKRGLTTFYPEVVVTFEADDSSSHYHVPLLISPFGYSTYRGS